MELYSENSRMAEIMTRLYADEALVPEKIRRAEQTREKFEKEFGHSPEYMISSPGRTEICGNHCDHQRGSVLAAAVNTDILAFASKSEDWTAHIYSEGYGHIDVDLNDLSVNKKEAGTSAAMVRGIAAAFKEYWITVSGFYAYITSDVPVGSGISSSAAFENAVANIFAAVGGRKLDAADIARVGKIAENKYFGKPSGLMDQMAAACGGMIYIDFENEEFPKVERLDCDFSSFGISVCIVNTGKSHANLGEDYASVPAEMKRVASFFGKKVLKEVEEEKFYSRIDRVRAYAGDRAVMRAIHFYEECRRVEECRQALISQDKSAFLKVIHESGDSSWKYLQNIYSPGSKKEQSLGFALALSEHIIGDRGACRVHGGGFAGTIQAFVPDDLLDEYRTKIEKVFGRNSCSILKIRNVGGCSVKL